jgi:hypothetical protein
MSLAEDPNYRNYATHIVVKDYPAARADLEACLINPSIDPLHKSMLLQRIGGVYFLENNVEQSLHYYELGEKSGWASLAPYLSTAKFLAEKLHDYERSIAKCDEIIQLATLSPTKKNADDESSDYYITQANELKTFCLEHKAGA